MCNLCRSHSELNCLLCSFALHVVMTLRRFEGLGSGVNVHINQMLPPYFSILGTENDQKMTPATIYYITDLKTRF